MALMHRMREAKKEADPIQENIRTIADLSKHAEHNISPQQRVIEKVTDFLGRPIFLFIILLSIIRLSEAYETREARSKGFAREK